jgi:hypothetical protein
MFQHLASPISTHTTVPKMVNKVTEREDTKSQLLVTLLINSSHPDPLIFVALAQVRIGGAFFFLFRNVSRGVPLETLSLFIFSYCICSQDMSREQQLQIPPKEVIANSPLTNRIERCC